MTELEASLTAIVKRDLKLDDVDLQPDTPLDAEDLDLDSLDFLMLVASIEKELGVKIPNEQLGAETFASIGKLAEVVGALKG